LLTPGQHMPWPNPGVRIQCKFYALNQDYAEKWSHLNEATQKDPICCNGGDL